MNSLRTRLFLTLVAATGLIWLSAVAWIYVSTRIELEHVLDTRLREAATMVDSLISNSGMQPNSAISAVTGPTLKDLGYERQLSCQIWSLDGHLVARSNGAPDGRLSDQHTGFSQRTINNEAWRVYSIENAESGIRVLVGDRLGLRDKLVADLIKGLLVPMVLILPAFAALIWFSLGRGLKPLLAMAGELQTRSAEDMRTIETAPLPRELKPLGQALNALLARVAAARQHERDVTAFAAHELRTPLAGLKTQAQIALAAKQAPVRKSALQQILVSVDRSTRLVRQLLALARLDVGDSVETASKTEINLGDLAREVVDSVPLGDGALKVDVDPRLYGFKVHTCREHLILALRNLHENAVAHSPPGGAVTWRLGEDGRTIVIADEGPGMSESDLSQADRRFFRGSHTKTGGSGLGLTIAKAALRQIGGELQLANRTGHTGLRAIVGLPHSALSAAQRDVSKPA